MKFSSAFFVALSTFVVTGFASSPAQVKEDVAKIITSVKSFDQSITRFPAKDATEADYMAVKQDGVNIAAALGTCTVSIKELKGPVSDADATALFDNMTALAPVFSHSLQVLTDKKAAIMALGHAGEIKAELVHLEQTALTFCDALIAKAPMKLKVQAVVLKAILTQKINVVIAAY